MSNENVLNEKEGSNTLKNIENPTVHDSMIELHENLQQLQNESGYRMSSIDIVLSVVILICPPIYFYLTCKNNNLFDIIPLAILSICCIFYCKRTNYQINKPYKKLFGLIPNKANIYSSFTQKCLIQKIKKEKLELELQWLDIDNEQKKTNDFISLVIPSILLAIITDLITSFFKNNEMPKNFNLNAFLLILIILFSVLGIFFIISNIETNKLLNLKKCIIHTLGEYEIRKSEIR